MLTFIPLRKKRRLFFRWHAFFLNQMGWCHTDPSMREIHGALQNQSLEGLDEFGSLGIEGFEHLWDVQRQFSFMFLFHSDINKDDAFRDVLYCIVYCIASFFPSASHKFESNDNVVSEIRLREAFICWIKHCEVVSLLGNVWGAYHPLDTNSLVSKHEKNCGENSPIAKRPSLWWKLGVWPNFGKGQLRRSETVAFGVFLEIFPDDFLLVS